MPESVSTRSAYKMLTCIYLCRTLLFFAPYADFFMKKLSVSLYFYDMFWKRRKMEATIYDDTFHRQDISYSPTRTFGIGISYRFGNLKDAIKKVKRGIRNDDVKALESGS